MNFLFFLSLFFINPPRSAAEQWIAIKYIPEVRSYVKLQQLIQKSLPSLPYFSQESKSAKFGVVFNITQI